MVRHALLFSLMTLALSGAVVAAPIHDAVTAGDLETVRTLIEADPALISPAAAPGGPGREC